MREANADVQCPAGRTSQMRPRGFFRICDAVQRTRVSTASKRGCAGARPAGSCGRGPTGRERMKLGGSAWGSTGCTPMLKMDPTTLRKALEQLDSATRDHAEWQENLLRSIVCGLPPGTRRPRGRRAPALSVRSMVLRACARRSVGATGVRGDRAGAREPAPDRGTVAARDRGRYARRSRELRGTGTGQRATARGDRIAAARDRGCVAEPRSADRGLRAGRNAAGPAPVARARAAGSPAVLHRLHGHRPLQAGQRSARPPGGRSRS